MTISHPARIDDSESRVTTVIADDLEIKGSIRFKSSLMIKGIFEGEILSDGLLIIGATADVKATIKTKKLITYGIITGNVTAEENVVLKTNSRIMGDITTPNIIIENGSVFNGSCIMSREYTPPPAPREPEKIIPPPPQFEHRAHPASADITTTSESRESSSATESEPVKVSLPSDEKITDHDSEDKTEAALSKKKKGFWGR
jgi:cytoskeletal protein CcmA (bactofilin family)